MRGLGAGMVNVGQMMKEQQKLDWETKQMNLKYERDQHMAQLAAKNNRDLQQDNQSFQIKQAEIKEKSDADRFSQTTQLQRDQLEQTGKYQQDSLGVQRGQADASRTNAEANLAQATKVSASDKITQENYDRMLRIASDKFPDDKNKQDEFIFTMMSAKDKNGNRPPQEVVVQTMTNSDAKVLELKEKDSGKYTKLKQALGLSKLPEAIVDQRISTALTIDALSGLYNMESITGSGGKAEGTQSGGGLESKLSEPPKKQTVDVNEIQSLIMKGDTDQAEDLMLGLKAMTYPNINKDPKSLEQAKVQYDKLQGLLEEKKKSRTKSYWPSEQKSMLNSGVTTGMSN